MSKEQAVARVVAYLATLDAESLATTLHLTADRFSDVATRLIERFGETVTGNEIYLGLYALERDPALKHLFAPAAEKASDESEQDAIDGSTICGMPAAAFLALAPEKRLALCERDQAAKREAARANMQREGDAIASAARPPDFDSWTPDRKLQWANEAQALAAKAREKANADA